LRAAALVAIGVVVGGMTLGSALAQQAATGDGGTALAKPGAVRLDDRGAAAAGLLEARLEFSTNASPATGANRLLAISGNGAAAAVASQVGPQPATLVVARRDGSELAISMNGLIGAGFAPDASWLAVIDGAGAMWRASAASGALAPVADGPFIGQPVVAADGSVLALEVSSVEAPIVSRLVRISPQGVVSHLTDDDLVYAVQVLADGSVALATHRGSRTVVLQLASGHVRQLADLGEDAVHPAVSPQADAVAFERYGVVFLVSLPDGFAAPIGPGWRPQFSPDGQSILLERLQGAVLVSREGREIASLASQGGFAACGGECRP
jgi:hypothetical protein